MARKPKKSIAGTPEEVGSEKASAKYRPILDEMPSTPQSSTKNVAAEDSTLTPKQTPEALPSEGAIARTRKVNAPSGRRNKTGPFTFDTPKRGPMSVKPGEFNAMQEGTGKVSKNLVKRRRAGMGRAGEEKGILQHALQLAGEAHVEGIKSGKIDPNTTDLPSLAENASNPVQGSHFHALAKVLHHMPGVTEDQLRKQSIGEGMSFENKILALHSVVQKGSDAERTIKQTPNPEHYWEHPETKQIHKVSEGHPDMPRTFTRSKQQKVTVTRDSSGAEVVNAGHVGYEPHEMAGGHTVWRKNEGPKGTSIVKNIAAKIINAEEYPQGTRAAAANKTAAMAKEMADSHSQVIGTRQRGKAKTVFTQQPGKAPVRDMESVTEPLTVPKGKQGSRGQKVKDVQGNLVPQPPEVRGYISRKAAPVSKPKKSVTPVFGDPHPTTFSARTRSDSELTNMIKQENRKKKEDRSPLPITKTKFEPISHSAGKQWKQPELDLAPTGKTIETPDRIGNVSKVEWKNKTTKAGKPIMYEGKALQTPSRVTKPKMTTIPGSSMLIPEGKTRPSVDMVPPKETTGMEDLRTIKNDVGFAKPKLSESTAVELRPGGKRKQIMDRAAGKRAAKESVANARPMQQPTLPGMEHTLNTPSKGRQFLGTQKVQDKEALKAARSTNKRY